MANVKSGELSLSLRATMLVALPLGILIATDAFLISQGQPFSGVPPFSGGPRLPGQFVASLEGAARLKMLAAFVLLAGAAGIGALFFARVLSELDRRSWSYVAIALLITVGVAGIYFSNFSSQGTQDLLGRPMVCRSLTAAQPDTTCMATDGFKQLRRFFMLQQLMLFVAIPAMVFGAISCLARPVSKLNEKAAAALCSKQTERLNIFLYFSAFIMVSGLLVLSAALHWAGHGLQGADLNVYRQHVNALILFFGISYSLFIASYYVPVSLVLARQRPTRAAGVGEKEGRDLAYSPFSLLRIAATVFAPALVGLLGEVMKVPS